MVCGSRSVPLGNYYKLCFIVVPGKCLFEEEQLKLLEGEGGVKDSQKIISKNRTVNIFKKMVN